MITSFSFAQHASRLAQIGIPQKVIEKLGRMLSRIPTGKPNSRSMPSYMQSIKMPGMAIAPGSDLETVHALTCEADHKIAAYVDEPESLGISWTNADGTVGKCNFTPDGLVVFTVPENVDQAWKPGVLREIKSTTYLEKHRSEGKLRYVLDQATGRWRCPSAEKVAEEHCGLGFEVITELDLDRTLARNVDFLSDYLRVAPPRVPAALAEGVREYVAERQGCTLEDLLTEFSQLNMDKFCSLVVHRELYVPLSECHLPDARQIRIYSDAVVAEAHAVMLRTESNDFRVMRPPLLKLGEELQINGVKYEVVDDSKAEVITIRDEALGTKLLRRDHALRFHRSGCLQSLGVPSEKQMQISRILTKTPPAALQAAMLRLDQLSPYIHTNKRRAAGGEACLTAAQRYWLRKARRAHEELGLALVGCIDGIHLRGNRASPLSKERLEALDKGVNEYYLCQDPGTKSDAFVAYKTLCKALAVQPVSEKTFRERLKKIPRATVVRTQEGEIAAHSHEAPSTGEASLAARPEFFMHVGRLDEFKFDLALLDPDLARVLGTMWVAVLLDGYSRSVLAFSVTFESPSYHATTLVVLRKCVQRWGRLPCIIYSDNGPGFKEDYKEAASSLGFRATWRRSGRGRDDGYLERFIGVTQQRVGARLRGRTALVAKHRRLSKEHMPETRAVYFPLDAADFFEEYFFKTYDELPHDGLNGKTPRAMREASLGAHGARAHANIDLSWEIETLMLPKVREDGDAKVQAHDGVQAFKLLYWHKDFGDPRIVGTRVPMRWDPTDITQVRVFVGGQWVVAECLKLRHLRALPREQLCLMSLMIRHDKRLARMRAEERIETINEMLRDISKSGVELDQVLERKASAKLLAKDLSFLKFNATPAPEPATSMTAVPTTAPGNGMTGMPVGLPSGYIDQLKTNSGGDAYIE
jgi:putative transposase